MLGPPEEVRRHNLRVGGIVGEHEHLGRSGEQVDGDRAEQLALGLDDAVSFESGALVEPAAVAYRAIDRAAPRAGARVLVVCDGTVGLLAARLVRLWEPSTVDLLGARPAQAELAAAAGVDTFATDPAAITESYDLVIEAAGVAAAVETALASTARGGSVVLLGLAGTGEAARLLVDDVVNGDITIIGSFAYTAQSWTAVVDVLNAGRLSLDFLVTHRFQLEQWQEALATLRHSDGPRGKVQLHVPQSGAAPDA